MVRSVGRWKKYFQRWRDKNEEDCRKFGNFISWCEFTVNFGRQSLRLTHVQCIDCSKTAHLRDYFLFTLSLQTKLMCHEKNGWIDGRKSRTHIWKLVPTSTPFLSPYWLVMGCWLVMRVALPYIGITSSLLYNIHDYSTLPKLPLLQGKNSLSAWCRDYAPFEERFMHL